MDPFPISTESVSCFAQFLSYSCKAPTSIKNYVYGLQTAAQFHGWWFPNLSTPHFKHLFKGLAKGLSHIPKRAYPVSPPILLKLFSKLDMTSPYDVSFWAVTVIGFQLFARISNLLPPTPGKFEVSKQLTRKDVSVAADAVVINLKWSKTNQLGDRIVSCPLVQIPGSPLCPKSCLLSVLMMSPGSFSDHLFAYRHQGRLLLITQSEYVKYLRKKLKEVGLSAEIFSGHSLRRGGATWAFASGVRSELIKSHGDWRSDSYLSYLQFSFDDKLQVSRLMSH